MPEIRAITPDELEAFIRLDDTAFGTTHDEKALEEMRLFLEPGRCVAAFEGRQLVGSAATLSLQLGVPGGRLAAAGVTWVGVHPVHRRRGILRALMRHQLDSYRDSGEPVAALGASESGIYRRFGYGMASRTGPIDIERAHAGLVDRTASPGAVELVDTETVLRDAPEVYDRVAAVQNGMFSRSPDHWRMLLLRAGEKQGGQSAMFMLLHRDAAGCADGYAAYRIEQDWAQPHDLAGGTLSVSDFVAATNSAYGALWHYLLTLDLVSRIVCRRRPVEEPLDHLLRDPRRLRRSVHDDFHVRIVDVPRALSARRYARDDMLVLDVRDGFCPANGGRYRLQGGLEGADCVPTDAPADLTMDVAALGAAYLGDTPLGALAAAGLAEEHRPGGLRRAAAMLSWPEPPFSPQMF